MIEDLIIIIPTHNRQHYLGRVIKYYSSFSCKVYICDSSKQKANVESCPNIVYRWVPKSNFYEKVLDVINETSADFYALSPDDDFLKEETLMECLKSLRNNKEYSMGTGLQVSFDENFDNVFFFPPGGNSLKGIKDVSFNDKKDYATYFESHYQNILWSLFTRSVITNAFTCLKKCNFSNGNFVELILGIETIKHGLVYYSNNVLNYREAISGEHWGTQTLSITRDNIKRNKSLQEDLHNFRLYYGDNSFEIFCLDRYLDAPFHKSYKSLMKSILPMPIISVAKFFFNKWKKWNLCVYEDSEMSNRISKSIN